MSFNPTRNDNKAIIRFSTLGKRFYLGGFGDWDDPTVQARVALICKKIELDIRSGAFCCENNQELAERYVPELSKKIEERKELLFLMMERLSRKYSPVDQTLVSLLRDEKPITTPQQAQAFIDKLGVGRKAASVHRYLDSLKAESDLFKHVKISLPRCSDADPWPFSLDEKLMIEIWFEQQRPELYPFVQFLFLTGTRISEAIGLRYSDVDLSRNLMLTIQSSLVSPKRDSERIRKSTKTGKTRKIPISGDLIQVLGRVPGFYDHCIDRESDKLVFGQGPELTPIDDHNFSQKIWKKCLKAMKIPYRPPKATRQTFISHALDAGIPLTKVARLTHNSPSGAMTILKHYEGLVNRVNLAGLYQPPEKT